MSKDIEKRDSGGASGSARKAAGKAAEFIREESKTAIPAAKRAATHAARVFWKRFLQEYRKEKEGTGASTNKERAVREKRSTGDANE